VVGVGVVIDELVEAFSYLFLEVPIMAVEEEPSWKKEVVGEELKVVGEEWKVCLPIVVGHGRRNLQEPMWRKK
jgi:hypothetical protein